MSVRKVKCSNRNPKEPGVYDTDLGRVGYNGNGNWVRTAGHGLPSYWMEEVKSGRKKKE